MVFGVKLLTMDTLHLFLHDCEFNYVLYWIIVVVVTTWYTCMYGFVNVRRRKTSSDKMPILIFTFARPFFFGIGLGVVLYYIIRLLMRVFVASLPYVVVFLLIVSLFYVTKVLNSLYFKSKKTLNPVLRKTIMGFSLLVAFSILMVSLSVF
jgi:hypothetical protein